MNDADYNARMAWLDYYEGHMSSVAEELEWRPQRSDDLGCYPADGSQSTRYDFEPDPVMEAWLAADFARSAAMLADEGLCASMDRMFEHLAGERDVA